MKSRKRNRRPRPDRTPAAVGNAATAQPAAMEPSRAALAAQQQMADVADRMITCHVKGRLEAVVHTLMEVLTSTRPDQQFALALALAEAGVQTVTHVRDMAQQQGLQWCPSMLDPVTRVMVTPDAEPVTATAAAVRLLDAVHRQQPFDITHVFECVLAGPIDVFRNMFSMLTEFASLGRQGKLAITLDP